MPDRKIAAMYKEYGHAWGSKCGDCPHLCCVEMRSGRRYYKCAAYGESSATSTDWAKKWGACGLFGQELERGHIPLLDRIKHNPRPDNTPIKGQMDMFGGIQE